MLHSENTFVILKPIVMYIYSKILIVSHMCKRIHIARLAKSGHPPIFYLFICSMSLLSHFSVFYNESLVESMPPIWRLTKSGCPPSPTSNDFWMTPQYALMEKLWLSRPELHYSIKLIHWRLMAGQRHYGIVSLTFKDVLKLFPSWQTS